MDSETNKELILKRPRKDIATILVLQQNHYFLDNLQTYYEQIARNITPQVYPQLVASLLKLWDMIKFEYKATKKNESYNVIQNNIDIIKKEIKQRKYIVQIDYVRDSIQEFLLESGVTAFVNTKDYNPNVPEEEDRAAGFD